jgi:hypothetical protein
LAGLLSGYCVEQLYKVAVTNLQSSLPVGEGSAAGLGLDATLVVALGDLEEATVAPLVVPAVLDKPLI